MELACHKDWIVEIKSWPWFNLLNFFNQVIVIESFLYSERELIQPATDGGHLHQVLIKLVLEHCEEVQSIETLSIWIQKIQDWHWQQSPPIYIGFGAFHQYLNRRANPQPWYPDHIWAPSKWRILIFWWFSWGNKLLTHVYIHSIIHC